jgi:nucleotide-binding universal stress UspA family protein
MLQAGRGPALLVFSGPPAPATFDTMVSCAENLERDLVAATVGNRPGGVISSERELGLVTAAVRGIGAAIVVVAAETSSGIVRRLAASVGRPVLVARTGQPWQRVLSATDLRGRRYPVVVLGTAVAETRRAASMVLHNVAPGWAAPTALAGTGAGRVFAAGVARRLRRLARFVARTSPGSTVIVSGVGVAGRAIVDAAAARDADLLVVGMRRPSRRVRARCADHVIASTPGNVLVVPLGARQRDGAAEER